mmetsp:Transcript_105332/g.181680  ORF Transcript_105332/g.181680 Transcript_105332/m.181680 type:complete len:431 (-) Transcript_105332:269-1561(-)
MSAAHSPCAKPLDSAVPVNLDGNTSDPRELASMLPLSEAGSEAALSSHRNTTSSSIGQKLSYSAKGAVFWSSLSKTAMQGYVGKNLGLCQFKHWDFITEHLILGALPVKTKVGVSGNHLQKLQSQLCGRKLRIGLVVSCIQKAEFEGYGMSIVDFVQHADWQEQLDVPEVLQLAVPDYSAELNMEELVNVTDRIREVITDRREAVYVHCKAGKGRSWVVAVSYLVAHEGLSLVDATDLVKRRRPQVNPNKAQKACVDSFHQYIVQQRSALQMLRCHGTLLHTPNPLSDTSLPVSPSAQPMPALARDSQLLAANPKSHYSSEPKSSPTSSLTLSPTPYHDGCCEPSESLTTHSIKCSSNPGLDSNPSLGAGPFPPPPSALDITPCPSPMGEIGIIDYSDADSEYLSVLLLALDLPPHLRHRLIDDLLQVGD